MLDKISELLKTLDLPSTFLQAKLVQREEACDLPFTYFKTSYCPHIPNSDKEQVFISSDGYPQETSIGNIILEINGTYYTLIVEVGILDGMHRKYFIQQGEVTARYLAKTDLENANHIFLCVIAFVGFNKIDII